MKKEIIDTSLKQFLKYGIREMSIQKLVEPLGISTKTVYKHFKNKEELLEDSLNLYHTQQYQMLENLPPDQDAACLFFDLWYKAVELEYKVNKAFFQDLHYYYPELGKKIEDKIQKKVFEQFLTIINKGIKDGSFQKNIIPEVVLTTTAILYTAIVRTEQFKSFRISLNDLFLNSIALYIRGMCTKKGIQNLDNHILKL